MAQYQQKTDSREFEVANADQQVGPWSGDAGSDATEIAIRLWGPVRSDRFGASTWKADSVFVYMIADLVSASGGRIADEPAPVMGAHFDGSRQAVIAAKRIQRSILEFVACRPGEHLGAAILIYPPFTIAAPGFSGETVQQALGLAKPGQILLAENLSQRLRDLPGIEFRSIPALAAGGSGQTPLTELVWTTAERVALLQASVGEGSETPGDNRRPADATMIVHSPVRDELPRPKSDALPHSTHPSETVFQGASERSSERPLQARVPARSRESIAEEVHEGPGSLITDELDVLGPRPFLTRPRVILGAVAIVLVAALIAVLYPRTRVTKLPPVLPVHTEVTETPSKPTTPVPPEVKSDQPDPNALTPKEKSPTAVQAGLKSRVDSRVKSRKEPSEVAEIPNDAGGVSQKDIPALLKMAQKDAGSGNYDNARREFNKVLQLQPSNQDAKEGLRKLALAQSANQ